MNVDLHIFTNSTKSAPSTTIIEKTFNSFVKVFQKSYIPTIWLDSNPNKSKAKEYQKNLEKVFKDSNINNTSSLSDGYIKAISNSSADFMFMIEHDWEFLPTITHSIESICEAIEKENIIHFRFNKRTNKIKAADIYLEENQFNDLKYCITPFLSNNPHILHRKRYVKNVLKYIKVTNGSKGIEHNIQRADLTGAIYGPIDYPKTVNHLDGRNG